MKRIAAVLLIILYATGVANAETLVEALGVSGSDEGLNGDGIWTHPAPDLYTNDFKLALNFHGPGTTTLINTGGDLWLRNFSIGGSGDGVYIQESGTLFAVGQVDLGFKDDPALGKLVMNGGTFETEWMNVGFTGAGVGRLEANAGHIDVTAEFKLQIDSSIDITHGMISAGWEILSAANHIAAGRITGYGGDGVAYYSLPSDPNNPEPGKYSLWATVNVPWNPSPADGETEVLQNVTFSWSSEEPNTVPLDFLVYWGEQGGTVNGPFTVPNSGPYEYTPPTLTIGTPYEWRGDVFDPAGNGGSGSTITGNTWTFTTAGQYTPAVLVTPSPSGVTDIPPLTTLQWQAGQNATEHRIYFSATQTDVDSRAVAPVIQAVGNETYDPGVLNNSTPYYWAVDEWDGGQLRASGPTWSYTTEAFGCIGIGVLLDQDGNCLIDFVEFAYFAESLWLACLSNTSVCP